jgi:hypothetical protein
MQPSSTNRRFKVVLHGFGEYAVIYYHVIAMAKAQDAQIDFSIILPTSHHVELFSAVLPAERILNMEEAVLKVRGRVSVDEAAGYSGSIHVDIDAEKRTFKHRKGDQQVEIALAIYKVYKDFLVRERPDHVVFNHIEGYEQKMCASLCVELGIPLSVPVDCRTISGSAMCADTHETLPEPPTDISVNLDRAWAFVAAYREKHMPAFRPPPTEDAGPIMPRMIRPFRVRLTDFIRRSLRDPGRFEWDFLKAAVLNNLPWYRDRWYAMRRWRARQWYDLASLDELPAKFIYYPLHYSPESSINTPAPYFIDQMRSIDAIRHAMPSDYTLIVKDHPAALLVRRKGLMDRIRRSSGVRVMNSGVSGRDLVQRAAITISVTGTSTLEAFLLGRPSLTLGTMVTSKFYGGVTSISDLPQRLRASIASPPSDAAVVAAVAEVMTVAKPFSVFGLGYPGEPVFRENNIRNLLAAILEAVRERNRQAAH